MMFEQFFLSSFVLPDERASDRVVAISSEDTATNRVRQYGYEDICAIVL